MSETKIQHTTSPDGGPEDSSGLQPTPEQEAFNEIPAKTLRVQWKLAKGRLPIAHRHIAALTSRGAGASLQAWIASRVDQLLSGEHSLRYPQGVLVTQIMPDGEVDITAEPMPDAPMPDETTLLINDDGAVVDAGDASVWARIGGTVITPSTPPAAPRGTRSLVLDLARTMRYDVEEHAITPAEIEAADELFLVSDTFGVIAVDDRGGELSQKIADGLAKIWG